MLSKNMNECIEFHDSTLSDVKEESGACIIELRPVYVHRSDGNAGSDAGKVFLQDFRIIIGNAVVKNRPSTLPVELDDSLLEVGDLRLTNTAPIKMKEEQKVRLRLFSMRDSSYLEVEGHSISIDALGVAHYRERFPGSRNECRPPCQRQHWQRMLMKLIVFILLLPVLMFFTFLFAVRLDLDALGKSIFILWMLATLVCFIQGFVIFRQHRYLAACCFGIALLQIVLAILPLITAG